MRKNLPTGKQVADTITYARLAIACGLIGLGLIQGRSGLSLAVWVMIADWTGDCLDGPLARRSRVRTHTWIGDHDLAVDLAVSVGLLAFLLLAELVDVRLASAYLIAWALLFWRWHVPPALGMLFQAPIYGWFLICALGLAPAAGLWLIVWILAAIITTWPKFPKSVVPGFLRGLQAIARRPSPEAREAHLPRTRSCACRSNLWLIEGADCTHGQDPPSNHAARALATLRHKWYKCLGPGGAVAPGRRSDIATVKTTQTGNRNLGSQFDSEPTTPAAPAT